MPNILIIDDDQSSSRTLKLHFSSSGFDVKTAASADEGLDVLLANPIDVVVSDIRMPGRDGLSLLTDIRRERPDVPVIMITAFHDLDSTVAAMQGGAIDYITKPIDLDDLEAAVDKALRMRVESDGDALLVEGGDEAATIIGRTRAMKNVFKSIGMVSQSNVTVLILGESGTGKELVARAIHKAGPDADKPFVAVNCAALVETLLESDLFGHEKGAFTGAVNARRGKVDLAGEGTLFLDEIGELSPRMQGKLLRLLEEREYTPVGGTHAKISSARFVAATNVDLAQKVTDGEFREDLYYRLNVFSIDLPPLRERQEDIPLLVEHLLKRINKENHKSIRRVPGNVMDRLVGYAWPGNVRQLENVLIKAVVMSQGDILHLAQLPDEMLEGAAESDGELANEDRLASDSATLSLKDIEREHILSVLESTDWHKGKACEILGTSRPKLDRRIKEYGLKPRMAVNGGMGK